MSLTKSENCWTDIAGTPTGAVLDPTTKMLVNDLDLRITKDTSTYYPWKLIAASPSNAATNSGDNNTDNVEKVEVSSPVAGQYTITVTHKGTLSSSQNFSLIISGIVTTVNIPADVNILISGSNAIISWTPVMGMDYNVYSDTDPYGGFTTLEGTVTDDSGMYTDPVGGEAKKFYQVTTDTGTRNTLLPAAEPVLRKKSTIRSIGDSKLTDGEELKK